MKPSVVFRVGTFLLAIGIGAGAFGAHGLKGSVTPQQLETFEIGVRYQMYGSLGLMAAAAFFARSGARFSQVAAWAVLAGIAIFSGTLFGIGLGGPKWLGAITPIGGTLQIIGWALVARSRFDDSGQAGLID